MGSTEIFFQQVHLSFKLSSLLLPASEGHYCLPIFLLLAETSSTSQWPAHPIQDLLENRLSVTAPHYIKAYCFSVSSLPSHSSLLYATLLLGGMQPFFSCFLSSTC